MAEEKRYGYTECVHCNLTANAYDFQPCRSLANPNGVMATFQHPPKLAAASRRGRQTPRMICPSFLQKKIGCKASPAKRSL